MIRGSRLSVGALAAVLVLACSTSGAAWADSAAASQHSSKRAAPAAGQVATELVDYGARSAFVHVAAGGPAYAAAAGKGPPRAGRDRFRIGSVTKTFVAAIVLQLAEERKLRLDDPVERHLPGTIPLGDRITLRHLLNHTSGLANYTDDADWLARAERSRRCGPSTSCASLPRSRASSPGPGVDSRTRTRTTSRSDS